MNVRSITLIIYSACYGMSNIFIKIIIIILLFGIIIIIIIINTSCVHNVSSNVSYAVKVIYS